MSEGSRVLGGGKGRKLCLYKTGLTFEVAANGLENVSTINGTMLNPR